MEEFMESEHSSIFRVELVTKHVVRGSSGTHFIDMSVKIFSITKKMKKLYCVICGKYRKFEKPKLSYFLEKTLVLLIICSKCKIEDDKLFKEEE